MNNKYIVALISLFLTMPIYAVTYDTMIQESKDIVDGGSKAIAPYFVLALVWIPVIMFFIGIGILFWWYNKKQDDRRNPTTALVSGILIALLIYAIFYMAGTYIVFNLTGSKDGYTNMVTNYFSTMLADYI